MNTKIRISIVMLIGCLAVTSCLKKETTPPAEVSEAPAETPEAKPAEPAVANTFVVEANDQMQYNTKELKAEAGKPITVTLKHVGKMAKDVMGHNFVVLKEGIDGAKEDAFIAKANGAKATDYIPESEKSSIIAHTKLLGGGEEDKITFTIDKKGTYNFLCTFPAHATMMKGVLIVE